MEGTTSNSLARRELPRKFLASTLLAASTSRGRAATASDQQSNGRAIAGRRFAFGTKRNQWERIRFYIYGEIPEDQPCRTYGLFSVLRSLALASLAAAATTGTRTAATTGIPATMATTITTPIGTSHAAITMAKATTT